jgi:glycosyltransferase involved in cell wall biosynthesis
MALRAIQLIRKHGCSFDVIHGQSIYPPALAARIVAQHLKVPFVVTLRDDLSHLAHMYEVYPTARGVFEKMFAAASAIFVHGPAIQRDMPAFLPSGAKPPVVLAPNGADFEGVTGILDALPNPVERPWAHIVSVGNLYRFKGIHENLQALKALDEKGLTDWRYTVVGEGPYRQELEALAVGLDIGDRVTFTGRLPHHEAIRLIRESDIFSLPSWAEPFGNVYVEAAICGRPSIGCRGYGAEVTVANGETGFLVPPKDVAALADAMATLLKNPDRARDMGEAAREHIRQFTWEKTAEIYSSVIDGTCRGEGRLQ